MISHTLITVMMEKLYSRINYNKIDFFLMGWQRTADKTKCKHKAIIRFYLGIVG